MAQFSKHRVLVDSGSLRKALGSKDLAVPEKSIVSLEEVDLPLALILGVEAEAVLRYLFKFLLG